VPTDGSAGAVEAPPAGDRRALTILFVTVFIDLLGFGIVIPLLPLYAEEFGASPLTVTWLVAVYSLMQFLVAPWWGAQSDRHGRRIILLIGLFGSALSYLIFGLAGSLTVLFVGRILAGIMGANIGVAQAYVADVTTLEGRARGMGVIGAAFGLGFIFGPVVGGLLAPFGLAVPFLAASGLALLNGLLAIVWLPESLPPGRRGKSGGAGVTARLTRLAALSRDPAMRGLYIAFFLITFAFAGLEATLSLWADRRWSLTPAQVAYLFGYLGLVVTIVQGGLVGPIVRRLGERRAALTGAGFFAAGLIVTAVASNFYMLAVGLGMLGLGQGLAIPAVSALISVVAPEGRQGQLLGISQSLSAMGRVLGPLWGGLALGRIGLAAPYITGAGVVLVAGLVLAFSLGSEIGAPPRVAD
jgi:DHA1 family tetracycline resistance protein-like MFS transporter